MLSILSPKGYEIPHADEKLSADLLLDTTFTYVCPNLTKRKIFLAVLTNPSVSPEEIAYRSEILRDFIAAPNLCASLRAELDLLLKLRDEAQSERSGAYTSARSNTGDAAFGTMRHILNSYAATAANAVRQMTQISLVLSMYRAGSPGLSAIQKRADAFCAGAEEFGLLCGQLADYTDESFDTDVNLEIGASGRVTCCELTRITRRDEPAGAPGRKIRRLFAKAVAPESDRRIPLHDPFLTHKNSLIAEALSGVSELLDKLTREIYDEFCPLARELSFYEVALAYANHLKQRGMPLCTPQILTDGSPTRIEKLCDLLLAVKCTRASEVVPNDALIGSAGILITGENNSGKTVYLRSIGTAQLLFQAGLPIPAQDASMRIYTALYTRYAAAEKEFCEGNDAGRFEQEVREIAPLIDSAKPGSMLLLNELFQTTSYAEGARGLYAILRYLNAHGTAFILVTHLRDLISLFGGDALHMQTREGYRMGTADG